MNSVFKITFISTLALFCAIEAGLTQQSQTNSPGAVMGGRDVTINPDPEKLTCRHSSHGVERYQRAFNVTRTSGEMGGGHTQDEWCNNVIGALSGEYPGGNFSVVGKDERSKNHCWPSNCPQYTYICTVRVEADPVYKAAVGPECR
jgi:hypothetical protein